MWGYSQLDGNIIRHVAITSILISTLTRCVKYELA